MKRKKQLQRAFGVIAESNLIDFPVKVSNIKIARLLHCKKECPYCFPHGFDTFNSTESKLGRSWKCFRNQQWK